IPECDPFWLDSASAPHEASRQGIDLNRHGGSVNRRYLASFRFSQFVFHGRDFALHFAHANMLCCATRPIEEVNEAAGSAAKENDEKAHRPDQFGNGYGHVT